MLKPKITQFGEKGMLLSWEAKITDVIHNSVLAYQNYIEKEQSHLIQETNIGYQSVLILLANNRDTVELISIIENISTNDLEKAQNKNYLYTIPVCYDNSYGFDIEKLASEKNISTDEIIELHSNQTYKVYFTGFLPGFLYLGGLSSQLHAARLPKPRLEIPKGSVGIGGEQTGIYPQNSPGGWQIIGRTPLTLFKKQNSQPTLCEPGDKIQFKSISLDEFQTIALQVQTGVYTLRKEALND